MPTKVGSKGRRRIGLDPASKPGPRAARLDKSRSAEASRVGKRGAIVIPADLRRLYGILEGSMVIAEACEGGVLIRPAKVVPVEVEVYTDERKAEFLLSNAIDAAEYAEAAEEVRAMGLDPDAIPHHKPRGI